jgi:hypothetical protein
MFPWVEEDLQRLGQGLSELTGGPVGFELWRIYLLVSVISIGLTIGLVSPARWQAGVLVGMLVSIVINTVLRLKVTRTFRRHTRAANHLDQATRRDDGTR